jgi:parallel beta-helix repeat protein
MKSTSIHGTIFASVLASAFFLTISLSEAKVVKLTCSAKKGINAAVLKLKPGDTLAVTGDCNENVVIPAHIHGITIDGQGSTTVNGIDTTTATLINRGTDNTVKNLIVTGGQTGIHIQRSSSATIDGVTVNGVGGIGILASGSSTARIVNSTIQNNGNNGVSITENSNARIGFLTNNDTTASPNTISGNNRGITVSESSNATIIGNNISNNSSDGILVNTVSHADIASNTINGNGAHGINFGRNSAVNLGADTGTSIFDTPNSTTVNNAQFGLRCFINSSADGVVGTLNGASGAKDAFTSGCIDATQPVQN